MEALAQRRCVPCEGGMPAMGPEEIARLAPQVPRWRVVDNARLERTFRFPDFAKALDFVNRVGAIAEEQGHHPEITFTWGRATVVWNTHAAHGLTENDFIMAARTDQLRA